MPSESCKDKETVQFSHVWRLVQVLKGLQKPLLEWQRCWVKTTLTVGVFLNISEQGFLNITKKVNVEKII